MGNHGVSVRHQQGHIGTIPQFQERPQARRLPPGVRLTRKRFSMSVQFVWDDDKAKTNLKKHQVGFDEASTVFGDPLAKIFSDDKHSAEEIREIIVGHSSMKRLLLVSFTERGRNVVRIISSRVATRKERKAYEENEGN
jgi:uncharacterized DUF497 family protein